eukprot:scaffold289_cov120-Skeletonema_dohrnii-CCMP3373.AAC.5
MEVSARSYADRAPTQFTIACKIKGAALALLSAQQSTATFADFVPMNQKGENRQIPSHIAWIMKPSKQKQKKRFGGSRKGAFKRPDS